ncbi:MAG: hypothetical protein MJA30_06070 [Cytophagales bacterium]|nr:hypothetical protein [Cytophagales bacterium]
MKVFLNLILSLGYNDFKSNRGFYRFISTGYFIIIVIENENVFDSA